jgi:hypothetical protein
MEQGQTKARATLPVGQINPSPGCLPVQCPSQKYFRSRFTQITLTTPAVSLPRGALAIVTDAGRDAVDAGSVRRDT